MTPHTIRMHARDNVAIVANAGGLAAGTALPRFAAVSETFELVGVLDGKQVTLYLDRFADIATGFRGWRGNEPSLSAYDIGRQAQAGSRREHGGAEKILYEDYRDPAVGPGEALVRVKACALNQVDMLLLDGRFPPPEGLPPLPPGTARASPPDGV